MIHLSPTGVGRAFVVSAMCTLPGPPASSCGRPPCDRGTGGAEDGGGAAAVCQEEGSHRWGGPLHGWSAAAGEPSSTNRMASRRRRARMRRGSPPGSTVISPAKSDGLLQQRALKQVRSRN